jgi:predicted ATP-dependent serine protease
MRKSAKEHRIISIKTLKEKKYETIDLGDYNKLFGIIQSKFIIMLYGPSGAGKSVFALQLCEELSKHGKLLYNSHEERDKKTIQDRVVNFNINSAKIALGISLPFEVMLEKIKSNHYGYVVLDSIQYMDFTYEQLKQLIEATKRKRRFGIIMISFGNTVDNPTRAIDHLHASDVKCFFKNGNVTVTSRYTDQPIHKPLFSPKRHNQQPTLF